MIIEALTDIGQVRKLNEDNFTFFACDEYSYAMVADGMGGHLAGEVASKMAVESVINYLNENDLSGNSLEEAILYANRNIYNLSIEEKSYSGMGTTLTACLVRNNVVQIANVGDSCCFGVDTTKIIKLTRDHSLVQELIDSGSLTEEEGRNHPKKNIITRALGTAKNVVVDKFTIDKNKFEILLLCSDGLTNEVYNEEIFNIIKNSENLDYATDNLISLAKEHGGRDNITVLLFGGEV